MLHGDAVPLGVGFTADAVEADEGRVATAGRHQARLSQHAKLKDGHLLLLLRSFVSQWVEGLDGNGLAGGAVLHLGNKPADTLPTLVQNELRGANRGEGFPLPRGHCC